MKRLEVRAAYVIGVALPLLEVLRRRSNFGTIAGYVDDFIAGGLLQVAAAAVSRGKRGGQVLLVAAWGILCGGMYSSFFGQLEVAGQRDVSGLPGPAVVAIKGVVFAVALAGLGLSIRSARPPLASHPKGVTP